MKPVPEVLEEINRIRENQLKSYAEKLRIDPFALSDNCALQPMQYSAVASIYSKIYVISQQLKLRAKEMRSEIGLTVRRNPENYGFAKITESALSEIVDGDENIAQIERALIEVNGVVIEAKGLLDAYEHRRSMLSNEVQLVLSGLEKPIRDSKTENYKAGIKKINTDRKQVRKVKRATV